MLISHKRALLILIVAVPVLIIGIGSGVAAGINPKVPIANTEANLTDSQRDALYNHVWQSYQARYQAWLASLDLSKVDFRSLAHRQLMASYVPPSATSLNAAVKAADLVVRGQVTMITPTPFDGTYVEVRVARSLKGSAPESITVHQAGGLRPTSDWTGLFIADSEDAPLMLPGDQVNLLLRREGNSFEPQAFTGLYWVTSHGVSCVPGNPFGAGIEGRSDSAFTKSVAAALAA